MIRSCSLNTAPTFTSCSGQHSSACLTKPFTKAWQSDTADICFCAGVCVLGLSDYRIFHLLMISIGIPLSSRYCQYVLCSGVYFLNCVLLSCFRCQQDGKKHRQVMLSVVTLMSLLWTMRMLTPLRHPRYNTRCVCTVLCL